MVDSDNRCRLTAIAAHQVVGLRPQFQSGHIFQAQNRAVGTGAYDDLPELLFGKQPALCPNRVGEFLALWNRLTTDLPGRINRILRLYGFDNFGNGDAKLGQLVRLDPAAHGILAGSKDRHAGNARYARQLVVQIDVRIVGQKNVVVSPFRRKEIDQHERGGCGFLYRDSVVDDVNGQLRIRLVGTHLSQDLICARIGLDIEVGGQRHLTVVGVVGIHVVHVVHAAHLLFDRRGHGLLDGLSIGSGISRFHLNFRWRDVGELCRG